MRRISIAALLSLWMMLAAGCRLMGEATPYKTYLGVFSAEYFLRDEPEYINDEGLLQDALAAVKNTDKTLRERMRAAELLCEIEYLQADEDGWIAREEYAYPLYGALAAEVFEELDIVGSEDFWPTLIELSASKELMYAAAPSMKSETLLKVYLDRDFMDDYLQMFLDDIVAHSLKHNQTTFIEALEKLYENGYFESTRIYTMNSILESNMDSLETLEEGLAFLDFFSGTIWPLQESYCPDEIHEWTTNLKAEDEMYYTPGLNISFSRNTIDLSHLAPAEEMESASIPPGKILALFCNGDLERYPGAGTGYMLCGDLMLNLPEDRRTFSADEIDLLLLLSTTYEIDGEYDTSRLQGVDRTIYAMEGHTSLYLYDWATGELVGYYGKVIQRPRSVVGVSASDSKEDSYVFPQFPNAAGFCRQLNKYSNWTE